MQLSTVKHMTTSCSFLPTIIRLTLSLPSTARAEQGRGELDEDPDQELDWKEHHIAPPHNANITNAPTLVFFLQVMPSPEFSWSHSLPHLVLPLQDTDHFRPDTYGAPAVPLGGASVGAVDNRNHKKSSQKGQLRGQRPAMNTTS